MLIYRYSGALTGFYTVIYEIYTRREPPLAICAGDAPCALDTQTLDVADDSAHASRVAASLRKKLDGRRHVPGDGTDYRALRCAFASGQPDREMVLFRYIRLIFRYGVETPDLQAHPDVVAFRDLYRRVWRELDRMKGFLRFRELANGVLYACYTPDNDLTELLLPYFCARNASTPFIIHDTARGILGLYNTQRAELIRTDATLPQIFSENERQISAMWRRYFRAVAVPGRENDRLQRACMPVRYRKNMPETF